MTPKQQYYGTICNRAVEALNKRGFQAWYCEDKKSALEKALSLISEEASVTWGGSVTLDEIGLIDALKSGNYNALDRTLAKDADERKEMYRKAFYCDWYLCSANAVSLNGEIINIDGTGNRVAAMMYGPDNVLLVVGANKLELTEEIALSRARNIASPINAARFNTDTPCNKVGSCMDCLSDESICSYITITRKCKPKGRIKLIIVGEDLGF